MSNGSKYDPRNFSCHSQGSVTPPRTLPLVLELTLMVSQYAAGIRWVVVTYLASGRAFVSEHSSTEVFPTLSPPLSRMPLRRASTVASTPFQCCSRFPKG